jgi:hypothetical protein
MKQIKPSVPSITPTSVAQPVQGAGPSAIAQNLLAPRIGVLAGQAVTQAPVTASTPSLVSEQEAGT